MAGRIQLVAMSQTNNNALIRKLEERNARYEELQASMNDPAVQSNPQRIIAASKEAGQLEAVVGKYREYLKAATAADELREMIENKSDPDMASWRRRNFRRRRRRRREFWRS